MKVAAGQSGVAQVEPPNVEQAKKASTTEPVSPVKHEASNSQPVHLGEPPTDVSVRRDNSGRIFYVVSDASSGQEILEVPPKALRAVDQGIEEYLKEEQSKAGAHVKVTA